MTATPDNPRPADLAVDLSDDSRIKVIGLGGIGCAVLQYLAVFLKSLARPVRLVLIDGDSFEASNSQRMIFPKLGNKADVKAGEIADWLEASDIAVVAVPEYVSR